MVLSVKSLTAQSIKEGNGLRWRHTVPAAFRKDATANSQRNVLRTHTVPNIVCLSDCSPNNNFYKPVSPCLRIIVHLPVKLLICLSGSDLQVSTSPLPVTLSSLFPRCSCPRSHSKVQAKHVCFAAMWLSSIVHPNAWAMLEYVGYLSGGQSECPRKIVWTLRFIWSQLNI